MNDLYPSRYISEPQYIPRREPVAWQPWRADAPLSEEQYRQWCENGFLQLDDVFTAAEVELFRAELDRLASDEHVLARDEAITEPEHHALRSLFAPHHHSAMYRALTTDERLLRIAEFLLASAVYIHQARVNFKPGLHGRGFFWHSDFETWHAEDGLPRMRTLSMSISLTDNHPCNGPLMLIPGSHRTFIGCVGETPEDHYRQSLKKQEIGVPDANSIETFARAGGIHTATGRAGSVTIFDCNTLHGSADNLSPFPRSNLFFVYNSVENLPRAPFASRHPRPWYIAEREDFTALKAARPAYARMAPLPKARVG